MTNDVNYFEIGSPDPAASRAFYGTLFGWDIREPPASGQYSMINADRGGLWDTAELGGGSWAIFYVQVEDVPAAIDRAQQLGASVVVPLVDLEAIEFAHLADHLGNRFGVWRPKTA